MDWVSEAAVSPKIIFLSPNNLDGPSRRNMKIETEIHQKSPGPIQLSITCIHIQVSPHLWKDSTNNRPRNGSLFSRSGFFFFFFLATPCGTWDPINSSPSGDWTSMPCTGSTESQPLNHQGSLSWSAQQGPAVWLQQSYIFRTSLVVH